MSRCVKRVIKASSFIVIAFIILAVCNVVIKPEWSVASYNPDYGFYDEPSNTIETLFLGSSHVHNGISAMDLYEDYGICAYDFSTNGLPMLASYYWLEEIYKLHSETLDTVVLDVSTLRSDSQGPSYHRAIDSMRFSMTKIHAVKAYSENFSDFLYNLFPIFSYHERWKELTDKNFIENNYKPEQFLRGYCYYNSRWIEKVEDFSEISTPLLILDKNEGETIFNETAIDYFKRIVKFCQKRNIRLVLIKTPTSWSTEDHNAVQTLADTYGLDFIDFNIDPFYTEIDFNMSSDVLAPSDITNLHLNYYGAEKLTDYLGQYLIAECGNRDVRGDERYAFMEEELVDYNQYITFRESLSNATDPCDYIETALSDGDYTIFISVKDDAASAFTEEQRSYFNSIGLTELSQLTYGCSYLAVIDDGTVITERYEKDPGERNANDDLISYTGTLRNGTAYTVTSGGYHMGNNSSIIIEDTERSSNQRGLNIAIYDNQLQQYVISDNFDTWLAPERSEPFSEQNYDAMIDAGTPVSSLTGTDRIMYLYNRECENEKTAKLARLEKDEEDGLITYLKAFWGDKDIDIFITTQGNVSEVLTDTLRTDLSDLGLTELSQFSDSDSYVAAIGNGDIREEGLHDLAVPLEVSSDTYTIKSIRREQPEDTSSVIVNGEEYSPEQDGIFIVIYDNITEMAVDTITFGTETDDVEEAEEAAG